jgi:hypothetical protein
MNQNNKDAQDMSSHEERLRGVFRFIFINFIRKYLSASQCAQDLIGLQ